MPNHITTILTFDGEQAEIERLFDEIMGTNTHIDFNNIIPMPATFRKYDTTNHPDGYGLEVGRKIDTHDDYSPVVTVELIEEFKRETARQRDLYGVVGWYDWKRKNWGTKWNAYDTERNGNSLTFNTAWHFPEPVIVTLSKQFPDVTIHYVYADEDAGSNTGEGLLAGGNFVEKFEPADDTPDSWNLYIATHKWAADNLELQEDGTYSWKEEE